MADRLGAALKDITDREIEWACDVMRLPHTAFAGEDGADPRLAVMRSVGPLDVEACPGSGKTTLLVAKLAILADRWDSRVQGICVLSHTNAARTEIGDRLSSTSAGHLLLRHPHFVGTIHSFVNEFLALPWLRSKGCLIKAIDTEIALNDRWKRLPWGTRTYLDKQHQTPASLTYTNPDYTGGGKSAFAGKPTFQEMLKSCQASAEAGYYCFDEMFVWASELLDRCPQAAKTIRDRFPLVFIDEVQDNSELQSAFLHRLFVDGQNPVIRQRFGDSNQAIYHRAGATGAVTDPFPGAAKADLPNSFRFGQAIADLANPLGVRPQSLVGLGPTPSRIAHAETQSALFLFDDASVQNVLPAYAGHLLESFSPDALASGDFTAVAAVHRADKDDHVPRFMGHYAPSYLPELAGRQPKPTSLSLYLDRARLELESTRNTFPIANRCAEGMLHFLRLAGVDVPLTPRKSANRYLLELIPDEKIKQTYLALVERLIGCRCEVSQADWNAHVIIAANALGEAIVGKPINDANALKFLEWVKGDASDVTQGPPRKSSTVFHFPSDDPRVSIRLGSIHGVKGETHTGTLVLESYQKTHHLKKLLPWILGKKPKAGNDNLGEDAALTDRLKLHYVAMTRPSHLLCLAMRKDSFTGAELDQMRKRGWRIIDCANQKVSSCENVQTTQLGAAKALQGDAQ